MRIRLHFEGRPTHTLDLPDFFAADVSERVKLIRTLAQRAYHMALFWGGNVVGLSGLSGKQRQPVIQNLLNEFKRLGTGKVLSQVVTGGASLEIREVSLLERTADGLGRWAQGAMGSKPVDGGGPGVFLGLDLGRDKVKTYVQRDGKGLFKGLFPSCLTREGEASAAFDQESLGRGVQAAALKTLEIGARGAGGGEMKVDAAVVVVSRHAQGEFLREPRWILEALHRQLGCPVWLHTDREAQALGCGAVLGKGDLCAVSLGRGFTVSVLKDGSPLVAPQAAEYFWEDTTLDCLNGSSLAFLTDAAELQMSQKKSFRSQMERPDTAEINQAAAAVKHTMHGRAVEVVKELARHLAWNLVELSSFCPVGRVVLTGARTTQIGPLLVKETQEAADRLTGGPKLTFLHVEDKINPIHTGAYGGCILAAAHARNQAVGGVPWTQFTGS